MKRLILSAALALGSLLSLARGANAAHTYSYTCNGTSEELQLRLNGSSAWTATDGGAGTTATPVTGDTIEIDGTTNNQPCPGDIFVNTSGLTFKNHIGTSSLIATDGISGMFEVAGANVTINGLELSCGFCSTSTANTTGLSTFDEDAALLLHDGATVLFENGEIGNSSQDGIFATANATISVVNSTIAGNGTPVLVFSAPVNAAFYSGIVAEAGSKVRLGNPDHTGLVTIAGNGFISNEFFVGVCLGYGLLLTGSTLESFAATIGGTGVDNTSSSENRCGQILLQSGSSARLEGNTITQTERALLPAVQVLASSLIITSNGAQNPVPTSISAGTGEGAAGAMLLGATSSAVLNASTILASSTLPTIEVTGSSTVTLAGGNTIVNSVPAGFAGIAFQIDHSSSLTQVPAHQFGFTDAADTVGGSAFVQVQSSMDLGVGLIGGVPSLFWSVPSGDCILIQQNSSLRVSGGVAIAGAPAASCVLNGSAVSTTIVIQQQSNAFFNVGRGGTNVISNGGGVSCVFAGMPNAHVTGKANISPAGAQPVIIGSWTQAGSATLLGCLGP